MVHYPTITTSFTAYEDWEPILSKTTPTNMRRIVQAVKDPKWQAIRIAMKGKPLAARFYILQAWGERENWSENSCIQIRNYIMACVRGGMITRCPDAPCGADQAER
jgi:hypothetical protein